MLSCTAGYVNRIGALGRCKAPQARNACAITSTIFETPDRIELKRSCSRRPSAILHWLITREYAAAGIGLMAFPAASWKPITGIDAPAVFIPGVIDLMFAA